MINGPGRRKCISWIDEFVDYTSNLESPAIYRKWSAITAIAAVLEQKVWVDTGSVLYPNVYTFLVGNPGIGKSRAIGAAGSLLREAVSELYFGATSMTRASLSDYMVEAKRFLPNIPYAPIEYNSLFIVADELSAFMHEYDTGLVAALVEFYDVQPYSEGRRVAKIRITMPRPQLNILTGSTPSNLINTMKDYVWEQGLMSRVFLIYSSERPLIDVFNTPRKPAPKELLHDLGLMFTLTGEFEYTPKFAEAMHNWKLLKMNPEPGHPKLRHYNTRRWAHLLKLAMIACVDRGMELKLDVEDFNKAMSWLLEAEALMPFVFETGSVAPDSRLMDEIVYFMKQHKGAVSEHLIINFARERASLLTTKNVLEVMQSARLIKCVDIDPKSGQRKFTTL